MSFGRLRIAVVPTGVALALLAASGCGQSGVSDRVGGAPTGPSGIEASAIAKGTRPVLSRVRVAPVATPHPDGRPRFRITATATDRDKDLLGGLVRLRLVNVGNQVLLGRIQPRTTTAAQVEESVTVAAAPGAFESATLEGDQLEAVFFLNTRPKAPLRTATGVQDLGGNRSAEVQSTSPLPPPTTPPPSSAPPPGSGVSQYNGRYTGTSCDPGGCTPLTFTVSNGQFTVSGGGGLTGSGTVSASGAVSGSAHVAGAPPCTIRGQINGNSLNGTYQCPGGTGTFRTTRSG